MFRQAYQEIQEAHRIIIHRHKNPDGDAIGSQIGLKHMICDTFPDKEVYVVGDDPKRYGFLADTPMDVIADSTYTGALAIILDTSATALISDERYTLASRTLRIDHHLFCEKIADVEVVDSSYESCCGLVTSFAMETGMKVSRTAATALFAGTVTDSGRFRFDSTSAGTFERVSFLLKRDIDTNWIYKNLYTESIGALKMKAHFIQKAQFTDNNVGYIYTTREELNELGISAFSASRGYVNTLSDLEGVNIWVAFAEAENGVLCELRAADRNINPIAVKYGGGGHAKASGATVADKATAMAMLKDLNEMAGEK